MPSLPFLPSPLPPSPLSHSFKLKGQRRPLVPPPIAKTTEILELIYLLMKTRV